MHEFFPLLTVFGVIGAISVVLIIAYASIKDKKEAIGFDRHMKDSEILRRLLAYAKPHKWSFLLVFLLMLLSILSEILSPYIVGRTEELLRLDFAMSDLLVNVAAYAVLLAISLIATYAEAIILQRTGQKIVSAIRTDLFTHIESLSHAQLHTQPVGKLVTRVMNDTNAISLMFTDIAVNLLKNVFIALGVLLAMLLLNYALTLMVLCFAPFIVLFTVIFRKFSRKAYRRVKDGTTDINTFLSENLEGMKIIRIFNREQRKLAEFKEKNDKLAKAKHAEYHVYCIFRPLVYMLYISSVLCLLYLGGRGYIKETVFMGQTITSGIVVSFYMYINKFFNPIQNLAEQFNRLQSAFASGEKIFTIFDMKPTVVDCEEPIKLDHVKGDIEFRDVWFAYEGEEWVLRGVSFKVKAGETAAFVGATGSGKTTILSLICRNYDIQRGEILIDGIDVRKIEIASLRRHFGQMLQDVFLFSGTVRSNIVLREDSFTDEAVMEACRYVNADKIIYKLPKGLDEEVRERGGNFSAGQRQLLSFARTVIHRPSVMILDEATANIDTETEVLIRDSLSRMRNIGTMLIVAHRLSTIRDADVIFCISKGEIVEQGNHDTLLERRGKYYDLYMMQYEKIRIEKGEDMHESV